MAKTTGRNTKQLIFYTAINLFSAYGYKNCSMRDLAQSVGIRAASLYKHYDGKEDILNDIFAYFVQNFSKYRVPADEIIKAAQTKPLDDILMMMFHTFGDTAERAVMIKISRIVSDMKTENEEAGKIFCSQYLDEPAEYIRYILNRLKYENRIFASNIEPVVRLMMAHANFTMTESSVRPVSDEETTVKGAEITSALAFYLTGGERSKSGEL